MPIHFFSEEIPFTLSNPKKHSSWLINIIESHHKKVANLNYIFCSDEYLLQINKAHLNHDFYTDIITFDSSESRDEIEGDIFISIDRVEENASKLQVTFDNELARVMAHGILHLLGFDDKTPGEKKIMREKEEACLSLQKS